MWSSDEGQVTEVWDGYTVFQAKHKERLSARPADNASWLWQRVREELDDWANPESGRNPVPAYLLIITNVPLTPTPGTGGHDQLNGAIATYIEGLADSTRDVDAAATQARKAKLARMSRLKKWRFWDANQLQALLTANDAIRRAFPGFLTAADVFANLGEITGVIPPDFLEDGLRAHARTTLIGESFIYFDEAGSGDGTGIPLHEVAIDLPVTAGDSSARNSAISYVLDRGEHVLKPKLLDRNGPRHLVIAGAPGNGKTTITKFLIQAYRAAMLKGAPDLSIEHETVIGGTEAALRRFGRPLPRHRRWPLRVDLAEYAQAHGLTEDSTLIRYIAEKVSQRSDLGDVKPNALAAWLRQWPWFLALDGLDEVTEPRARKRLIERVAEFVTTADADDCDTFVVLTTRPMGYAEDVVPRLFERLDLDYLEPKEALRYGALVTRVRLRNDLDRIDRVDKQLKKAATDESLRTLLRTPLQVLIMSIIVGSAGQLAPDRFSLFWSYYEIVFRRERDKLTDFHRVLQDHGQQIQQLHAHVGFELQARSELGGRSSAVLTQDELERLTWQVLHGAGFKPSGTDSELLAKILDAATKRLVLIAPRGDEGYGFDVRSLQELMAGVYLTTAPPDIVSGRLRLAAASPHWRNTWLFAAGRRFADLQDHEHQALVELVESVDEAAVSRLGNIVPIGPRLALDLIDDGMARSLPKWRDRLIAQGLRVLDEPAPADLLSIARTLVRFADVGDEQRQLVAEGMRAALGGQPTARQTTEAVQSAIQSVLTETKARPPTRGLVGVRKRQDTAAPAEPVDGWADFDEEVQTYPATDEALAALHAAAQAVRSMKDKGIASEEDGAAIAAALGFDVCAKGLTSALRYVAPHEPGLVRLLRDRILPPLHRAPIGNRLR
jgi:hypothetical protein